MCIVDRDAKGLLSYNWKFNEASDTGVGLVVTDLTGHSYDTVNKAGTLIWVENVRCPAGRRLSKAA
jgi:hypothetical protein